MVAVVKDQHVPIVQLLEDTYEVLTAVDGVEGIRIAAREQPDLILMDLSLPVLDGWEATRRLKADPVTRRILVVAMSENTETDARNMAMRVGCDAFASKPVDVEHLVESVEQLLPQ